MNLTSTCSSPTTADSKLFPVIREWIDVNDTFISSWYKILKKAYKDIINKKMESNLLVEYAIQYSVFGVAEDYIDEHWDTTISKKFLSIIPVDDCNYYIANKIIKIIKFNLK